MRPSASATSSLRTISTASTLPSPTIATGETQNRRRTVFGLPEGGVAATCRSTSTLRRATAVSSSSAAALAGSSSRSAGVDDEVRAGELGQLDQLGGRERRLGRPAAPEDEDLPDPGADDRGDRLVRRVGRLDLLRREGEHPGHVDRHVPVPDHDRPLGGEVERADPGSPGGRCTRRRRPSPATSRGDPPRGSPCGDPSGRRRSRRLRRRAARGRRATTSRPTSTFPKKRKPGRAAIFSNARETDLIFGWSGATPRRTSPHGVGRRSNMSTSNRGLSLASRAPVA